MSKAYIKIAMVWMLFASALVSCSKSEYFTDGGVHDPITPLNNYDYLAQHSWASFDTLVAIIDHYNLKEEVNQAATFFAPTDYSIVRYLNLKRDSARLVNENNNYTLDDMYDDISADSIRQYLFATSITLDNSAAVATPYTSLGKTTCAVERFLQTDAGYYRWGSTPVYSLYYIKVRGQLDNPASPPPANDPTIDTRVLCQTTGIRTNGGATTLHVLANNHVFVRF